MVKRWFRAGSILINFDKRILAAGKNAEDISQPVIMEFLRN